jgi:hypothetical protein
MQKLMRVTMAGLMVGGITIGLAGCGEESSTKTEKEIKGPGGTATVTDKETVKTTGKNPPSVPTDSKAP